MSEDIGAASRRASEAMRAFAETLNGGSPAGGNVTVAALVARTGDDRTLVFRERFTIGQGRDCGLRLDDRFASTYHAQCAPGPHGWTVEDLGSTNGTWLLSAAGPVRVRAARPVAKGDRIRVGQTVITLVPA